MLAQKKSVCGNLFPEISCGFLISIAKKNFCQVAELLMPQNLCTRAHRASLPAARHRYSPLAKTPAFATPRFPFSRALIYTLVSPDSKPCSCSGQERRTFHAETYIPAQSPPSFEGARVSHPYEDQERPRRHFPPPRQRPQAGFGKTRIPGVGEHGRKTRSGALRRPQDLRLCGASAVVAVQADGE